MISTQLTLAKTKMSIPCDHLWLAFCVCDRWVGLKEGECLLAGGEYRGKLLVWRSPCTHPGDVRKLTAVAPPAGLDCRSLRNLLVLSAEGPRPVADMMAGGDYDGDKIYCLVAEGTAREIVLRVNPVEPATYAARDERDDDALQAAAAANAARVAEVAFSPRATEARSSDLHGPISSLRLILEAGPIVAESAFAWKVLADHYGAASKEAVAMGSVAARALDLRATGELEALGRDLAKAKKPLRRGLVCPAWAATGKVPPWMKIGTGRNLVLEGIRHQLQVTEDTVEKRMKQLAVRDEASRRAASAAVEKQLKAVKEYSKCTSVPQPETSRSPEREARVLDDLAAAKRKVDVFAGGHRDRCSLVLERRSRKAVHEYIDGDPRFAKIGHRSLGKVEPKRLVLTKEERSTTEFPGLLRLLKKDGAGDGDASLREQFCAAVAFCEMGSVGEEKRFVFEGQHRGRVHDFFDCVEYEHVAHQTVEGKEILFKIKWAPTAAVDPMLDVARAHPEGLAKEMLDVEAAVKSVERATGAADRAPAPEIDERRAVDDVSAEAGDAAAAEEAAALQRALDESKACADEDAAAEAAERRSAELIVATMEARDEAEVKLADAVARQREAEDLARATALSARDIYGHEERKGGDSDSDYGDDEDDEATPLAMLQPGPMAWTIGGGALTYAARAVEDRHAGVVFSTEDVDLERALAASLAETSAKDDELERALAASRAESGGDGDDDELRAVLALSAREAVADEPDEVIDDAVVAASLQAVEADAERRRLAIDEEVARAYAALDSARPLPAPAACAPAASTRDDATALVGAAPAGYALVARFLSQLERPHLFPKFLSQNVDDEVLPSLNESDLDDMAIPSDSDAARAILGGIRDAEFIAGLRV